MNKILKQLYTSTYYVSLVPMKLYDVLHGTKFSRIVERDESDGRFSYYVSPVLTLPLLARYIRKRMQNGKGHSVLDIGCGKGFILLFLSKKNFDKVSGIEYDKKLCLQARSNLEKESCTASVIEADAVSFPMYKEYDTFYLYNPFDGTILEKCVEQILSSLQSAPRTLTVFYCNPVYGDVLKNKGFQVEGHFYYKTTVFVLRPENGRHSHP